jgi:hypothetical protein
LPLKFVKFAEVPPSRPFELEPALPLGNRNLVWFAEGAFEDATPEKLPVLFAEGVLLGAEEDEERLPRAEADEFVLPSSFVAFSAYPTFTRLVPSSTDFAFGSFGEVAPFLEALKLDFVCFSELVVLFGISMDVLTLARQLLSTFEATDAPLLLVFSFELKSFSFSNMQDARFFPAGLGITDAREISGDFLSLEMFGAGQVAESFEANCFDF